MKKTKKFLSMIITIILLTSFFSNFAVAEQRPLDFEAGALLTHNEKITDFAVLYQRAKNGVQDTNLPTLSTNLSALKATAPTGEIIEGETCYTTELLQQERLSSGEIVSDVALTAIGEIQLSGSGNKYEDGWDVTGAVVAYSTIYYSTTTASNGTTAYLLTSVSGGWISYDSTTYMSNKLVNYGCTGVGAGIGVGMPNGQFSGNIPVSGTTYNLPTGFTAYVTQTGIDTLGSTSLVTLQHGGSIWTFEFTNNL